MHLTLASMLSLTLPTALIVGAAGIYPTWKLAGWSGVGAEAAAAVVVLAVLIASDLIVIAAGRKEMAKAYYLFVMFKAIRPLACVALAGGAWLAIGLPAKPLAAWLLVLYSSTFAAEMAWMLKVRRGQEASAATKAPGQVAGQSAAGEGATC